MADSSLLKKCIAVIFTLHQPQALSLNLVSITLAGELQISPADKLYLRLVLLTGKMKSVSIA